MRVVNDNKVYAMAKEIWKKHFQGIMPFDMYYMQVAQQIKRYVGMRNPHDRSLFQNYQNNVLRLTYNELQKFKNR